VTQSTGWAASEEEGREKPHSRGGHKLSNKALLRTEEIKALCEEDRMAGVLRRASCRVLDRSRSVAPHFGNSAHAI